MAFGSSKHCIGFCWPQGGIMFLLLPKHFTLSKYIFSWRLQEIYLSIMRPCRPFAGDIILIYLDAQHRFSTSLTCICLLVTSGNIPPPQSAWTKANRIPPSAIGIEVHEAAKTRKEHLEIMHHDASNFVILDSLCPLFPRLHPLNTHFARS